LRKYPTEKSLATRVCFVGALQSSIVAAIAERHHPHAWALGWDTRLFAPAYAVSAFGSDTRLFSHFSSLTIRTG